MSGDSKKPPKGGSGEHPAVVAFRAKMDSIQEHTLPAAKELAERVETLKAKSDRPPADERREDDQEVPVDIVELPPEPPAEDPE